MSSAAASSNQSRTAKRRWPRIVGIIVVVALVLSVIGVFVARTVLVTPEEPVDTVTSYLYPVDLIDWNQSVAINAMLEPREQVTLSFPVGLRVSELLVTPGDRVEQGAVLARLETRELEQRIAGAQAALQQAERALEQLQAGATEVELAQAAASVAAARANLAKADEAGGSLAREEAMLKIDQARRALTDLEQGETPSALTSLVAALESAEAAVTAAETGLQNTRDSASQAKTAAQQTLSRGVQDLTVVQRAFSDAEWDWKHVETTGTHPREEIKGPGDQMIPRPLEPYEIEAFRRAYQDAGNNLANGEQDLRNLEYDFDQARLAEERQVAAAERTLAEARADRTAAAAELAAAADTGRAAALIAARKVLAEAERAYAELVGGPQRTAELAALQAALLSALAEEEALRAGPDPLELAQATTALERARSDLTAAEADLLDAELIAPISGTVVRSNLQRGVATPGDNSLVIADLSGFRMKAKVPDVDVAQLRVGQSVEIFVDAVPGIMFTGELLRVSELPDTTDPYSDPYGGMGGALGSLYPIEIAFSDQEDNGLRVGMAATAQIVISSVPAALVIPIQAVSYDVDGMPYVIRSDGGTDANGEPTGEQVTVELGVSNGDMIQVLSGLNPGEMIVVPQFNYMPEMPPGVEVPMGRRTPSQVNTDAAY